MFYKVTVGSPTIPLKMLLLINNKKSSQMVNRKKATHEH